jgi:hypothetical protein
MTEWPTQIITAYAGWTVLSALRSGAPVKSRRRVYRLLRMVDFSRLLARSRGSLSASEFARWHRGTTLTLCAAEPALSVGWATKMLNVYLKTATYVGGLGRPGLRLLLHPPIDGGLWKGLKRHFADRPDILEKTHAVDRIKAIRDYGTYEKIVTGCRMASAELGCLLIEVEQFWESGDVSPAQTPRGRRLQRRL